MKAKEKIDNLVTWTARAIFQVINEKTMRWETLSNVMDTPKCVNNELIRLKDLGYKNIWIKDITGRKLS